MKNITRNLLSALAAFLFVLPAWAGSLSDITGIANEMFTDLKVTDISLDVMSSRDAKSDPTIRAMLGAAPVQFEPGSVATALYYKGKCTVIVNTGATDQELRPELQRLVSKSDVLFFVTAHEVSHCISQHRQAQELRQLASGAQLTDTFLPPQILEQGAKGTLTKDSFAAILKSLETIKREEAFADALAGLYVRMKKAAAGSILSAMLQMRVLAAEQGDEAHDTVASLTAAARHATLPTLAEVVQVSHGLRRASIASLN